MTCRGLGPTPLLCLALLGPAAAQTVSYQVTGASWLLSTGDGLGWSLDIAVEGWEDIQPERRQEMMLDVCNAVLPQFLPALEAEYPAVIATFVQVAFEIEAMRIGPISVDRV